MTTPPDHEPRPVVVKLGGSTLGGHDTSFRDIAAAYKDGGRIVVVHGGGATISAWLDRAGIEPRFVRGLRVTDAPTLDVVVAVLAGVVNKQIVAELTALGAPAIGISGADGMILQARPYDEALGYVGKIHAVNSTPIDELSRLGYIPVIAPIAIDTDATTPQLLNTNADTAAGEIAAAINAETLVFLTDVDGVLDDAKRLLPRLTTTEAQALINSGVAAGGMIPKIEAAVRASTAGATTRIINGTTEGALASALTRTPTGTTIG